MRMAGYPWLDTFQWKLSVSLHREPDARWCGLTFMAVQQSQTKTSIAKPFLNILQPRGILLRANTKCLDRCQWMVNNQRQVKKEKRNTTLLDEPVWWYAGVIFIIFVAQKYASEKEGQGTHDYNYTPLWGHFSRAV